MVAGAPVGRRKGVVVRRVEQHGAHAPGAHQRAGQLGGLSLSGGLTGQQGQGWTGLGHERQGHLGCADGAHDADIGVVEVGQDRGGVDIVAADQEDRFLVVRMHRGPAFQDRNADPEISLKNILKKSF